MTRQQQRVLVGLGLIAAIVIMAHPRCNQACKTLMSSIIGNGSKFL
jgi:hypothetical protein